VIKVNNKSYLLTSNEGHAKDYSDISAAKGWTEQTRLKYIWNKVNREKTVVIYIILNVLFYFICKEQLN